MFLFEKSYQFAQGKKWGSDLLCTRWGFGPRSSDALGALNVFEKKGERLLGLRRLQRAAGCPAMALELLYDLVGSAVTLD